MITGIMESPDNCQACIWLKPFMVSVLYRYPLPHAPLICVAGLKFTIPNGLLADEKKNHLEFSVSRSGYTLSTNCSFRADISCLSVHDTRKKRRMHILIRLFMRGLFDFIYSLSKAIFHCYKTKLF